MQIAPNDVDQERAASRSWSFSFYVTLLVSCFLPIGLWLVKDWFREVLGDFEMEISRLTLLFLQPETSILTSLLPISVIAKEYLVSDEKLRYQCDTFVLGLSVCGIVAAVYALGEPMVRLIENLDG